MCGDPAIKYTSQQQRKRMMDSEEGKVAPPDCGVHGISPFVRSLAYLDVNNTELIPFGHTLLFGVVKDYWTIIFGSSKKAKRGSRGRVQVAGLITSASE